MFKYSEVGVGKNHMVGAIKNVVLAMPVGKAVGGNLT